MRTVGMGAAKKETKEVESKLKRENKELQAEIKALQKENAALRKKIAELDAAEKAEPEKTAE